MQNQENQSADLLLWLAAGVVVLMGLAWLVVAAPWSDPEIETFEEIAVAALDSNDIETESSVAPVASASVTADPLHMARMALDAGMLIEPAEFSAWTLYGRVVDSNPDDEAARDGLEQVAAALLRRGTSAFEQGRYEDAAEIAATIATRLPDYRGARDLSAEVVRALAPPEPDPEPVRPRPAIAAAAPAPAPVDPIPDLESAFFDALTQNAVLRPAGTSAIDIVKEMLAVAPDHEATIAARELLVTEMLDRSEQSMEALDTRASQTWIDSAASLTDDIARIERAQDRLTAHLIESETQRMLPSSELTQVAYVAPDYPRVPLERGIEGWVEVEFLVSSAGLTEGITVTDSSHERFFRQEAVDAIADWRFEPFIFMDRPIPKRAYTRLAFVLD